MTPLVALAASTEHVDGVAQHAVRSVYVRALESVGCAVAIVGGEDTLDVLDRFDGIVFGGHQADIAPERYGGTGDVAWRDPDRDSFVLAAVPAALERGMPVLGICRGLQELNVALGGTVRDLPDDSHREDESQPRDRQYLPAHEVRLTEGGILRRLLGAPAVSVNSLHHQAIDRLAPGVRVEAVAGDGVVEAVSTGSSYCLAVQWHPEWYATADPVSAAIFGSFAAAVTR